MRVKMKTKIGFNFDIAYSNVLIKLKILLHTMFFMITRAIENLITIGLGTTSEVWMKERWQQQNIHFFYDFFLLKRNTNCLHKLCTVMIFMFYDWVISQKKSTFSKLLSLKIVSKTMSRIFFGKMYFSTHFKLLTFLL
jgi:hypothetical protein